MSIKLFIIIIIYYITKPDFAIIYNILAARPGFVRVLFDLPDEFSENFRTYKFCSDKIEHNKKDLTNFVQSFRSYECTDGLKRLCFYYVKRC